MQVMGENYYDNYHDAFHAWNLLFLMTGKFPKDQYYMVYTPEETAAWDRYRIMIPTNEQIDAAGGPAKSGAGTHDEVRDKIVKNLAEQYRDQKKEREMHEVALHGSENKAYEELAELINSESSGVEKSFECKCGFACETLDVLAWHKTECPLKGDNKK